MQENYLAKWLNGELGEAELHNFKKSDAYASYVRIVAASDDLKAPDFDTDTAFEALRNRRELESAKIIKLQPFKTFLRVAAAAAAIMLGCYFYLNSLDESISTSFAENRAIILPDLSKVILNSDSQISYSKDEWDIERNLNLKGEAYFKVAKGKRFTVATDVGTVSVLGTQFNVENREGFFEVTCYEGLVSVLFNEMEVKLPAGKSFVAINGEITDINNPRDSEPSWINDESSFRSVPLRFVLDEFERQHNIAVEVKNIDLEQLFTGSFSNSDSGLALKSISVPSQIKFKFEGDKVLFYGENTP